MDNAYLQQALMLAQQRRGFCAPNPSVGALIVKENRIITSGNHAQAGAAHAEVAALEQAQELVTGATLYITLEPCCHWGRTPPCVEAIIENKLGRVVYAYKDPNPLVAGMGAKALEEAGIRCEHVSLTQIDDFYASYAHWQKTQTPFVTAKLALSLDGKIAGPQGEAVSITGEKAQQFTHQQRLISDAILTTAKTVNNDDPQFNVRLDGEVLKKPVYILDRNLILKSDLKIWETAISVTVFYDAQKQAPESDSVRYIPIETRAGLLNLDSVIKKIGEDGVHDLWVEAGGQCFQQLVENNLVHQAYVYVAAKVLGTDALPAFTGNTKLFETAKEITWQACNNDAICHIIM